MEDIADLPSPTGSPRQNNNLAQRLSRQFSRSFLPAIRNLVRPNRPRTRVAPEPDSPIINRPLHTSPILPIPTLSENISFGSPPPTRTDSSLICNSPPSNTTTTQEQEADDDLLDPLPPLVEDSSPNETGLQIFNNLGALATLNNLRSDDASEDNSDTNSNTRQRYRLVVYFEERANEEHPTARYVAVIVGRLDELQFLLTSNTNERGFGDVLNNLFNSYQPKGTPPASKDSIDSLPTVTITEQEQSCMICLEKFEQGSTAVVLPCKHTFHGEECVKSWLKMHNSCPICRYELPVEDEEYEAQRKERMVARGFNEDSATESTLSTEDNLQEDNLQLQFEGDEEEEGDHGHHVCDHDHHHHHHDFDDVFVSDENENEDEDVEMLDTDMSVGEENDSVNYLFGDD